MEKSVSSIFLSRIIIHFPGAWTSFLKKDFLAVKYSLCVCLFIYLFIGEGVGEILMGTGEALKKKLVLISLANYSHLLQ